MIFNYDKPPIKALLNICNTASKKYSSTLSQRSMQADIFIRIRQVKKSVVWRECLVKIEMLIGNIFIQKRRNSDFIRRV